MNQRGEGDLSRNIFLSLVVLVSLMSAGVLMLKNPTLTGGVAVQTIAFIEEGERFNFEIKNVRNVKEATIMVLQDVKNSKVTVEEITSPPFTGKVISAFRIISDHQSNFGSTEILLKIKESDLGTIKPEELKVYLNDQELTTTAKRPERGYLEYQVLSPGIGTFIIGLKEEKPSLVIEAPELSPEPEVQPSLPVKKSFFQRIIDFFQSLFS